MEEVYDLAMKHHPDLPKEEAAEKYWRVCVDKEADDLVNGRGFNLSKEEVDGLAMLSNMQLIPRSYSPGEMFDHLCHTFALAPIRNKEHHERALEVFKDLTIKVITDEVPSDKMDQANDYLETLGILIMKYEEYYVFTRK